MNPCNLEATAGYGRTDTTVVYFENKHPTWEVGITPSVVCPPANDPIIQSCSISTAYRLMVGAERDSVLLIYTLRAAPLIVFPLRFTSTIRVRLQVQIGSGGGAPVAGTLEGAVRVRAVMHEATLDPGIDARAPGLCVADCFEARHVQPTMGYRSLDAARGVTLVYSGATVGPRPFLHTTITGLGGTRSTGVLRMRATIGGVATPFVNGDAALYFASIPAPPLSTSPPRRVRLGAQVDASSYATGIYPLQVFVRDTNSSGGGLEDTVQAMLPVVNGQDSPIAKGWGIAGLQRRYTYVASNGRARVLIVDGDGSYERFDGTTFSGAIVSAMPSAGATQLSVLSGNFRRYMDGSYVEFDAAGYMVKFRDGKTGLITQYEYESWSGGMRLKRILDPYRKVGGVAAATVLTYGANGLASIAAPGAGGRTTTIVVNGSRQLTSITDPDTDVTNFVYDGSSRLSTVTDRRGGVKQYYYDALTWLVDSVSLPQVLVDEGGAALVNQKPTTRYAPWQPVGMPRTATTFATPFAWVYDTVRTATVRDPLRRPLRYLVDFWGQPTRVIDTLGLLATSGRVKRPHYYIYSGNIADSVWARWVPTAILGWTYDSVKGRSEYEYRFDVGQLAGDFALPQPQLVRERPAGGSDVFYVYRPGSNWVAPLNVDTAWGMGTPLTKYFYGSHGSYGLPDSIRSPTVVTDPFTGNVDTLFKTTRYTYAAVHRRVATETDPTGQVTSYTYDPVFGNLSQVIQPGTRTSTKVMDSQGRDSVVRVPEFADVVTTYDAMDRVLTQRVMTSPNVVTSYEYDGLYPTAVVDGKNQRYATDRNALGWATREYAANSTTSYRTYKYNAVGQMTLLTNRRGKGVLHRYDARDRLVVRADTGAGNNVILDTIIYAGVRRVVYSNLVSRDTVTGDPAQVERFGLVTTTRFKTDMAHYFRIAQSQRSAWTGADSVTITESTTGSWDTYLNTQYTKANGFMIFPGADAVNFNGTAVLTQYFDPAQRPVYQYGNAATQTMLPYMSGNRPSEVKFTAPNGQAVFRRTYGYDSTSRISQAQQMANHRHRRFGYDGLGRLKQVEYRTQVEGPGCHIWPTNQSDPGFNLHSGWNVTCVAPDSTQVFSYDAVGNRTDKTNLYDPGNRQRQFGTLTFTYDADGNVTQKTNTATGETWNYTWDPLNRLTQVKFGADSIQYQYDTRGRLARRRTNQIVDRHWVYVGSQVLAELDGALHKRVQYLYRRGIDAPLASVEAGSATQRFHVLDEQGNVVGQMTGPSATATVAQQLEYSPWGEATVQVASGNRLRWKGLLQDSASGGLYYMRNRWYDPGTGRFLSEDPIGLEGGINLYQFALGDPINYSDPFGLRVEFVGSLAEDLYRRLRQNATNATKSHRGNVATAGQRLLAMLNNLERDEELVRVFVGTSGRDGFGRLDSGEGWGIQLNPYLEQDYGLQVKLAHELGHAYSAMIDGRNPYNRRNSPRSKQRALEMENYQRTIWGCESRVSHDLGFLRSQFAPSCP